MILRKKLTIRNRQGLHARPAALFVRLASKFDSEITVRKGKEQVNGKSIMGILMLGCEKGSQIELLIEGKDAAKAIQELSHLVTEELVKLEKEG